MSIEKYIGIPYKSRGRGKSLDCWGLVRKVYKNELNIILPNIDGYTDSEDGGETEQFIKAEAFENWEKVKSPLPFNVVVFKLGHHCSHVGVMLDSIHFAHTLKGRMSCIERIDKAQWAKRVAGYYKWSPTCQ